MKGKRKTSREVKYFEKRNKGLERALSIVKEIGSIDWEKLLRKLEGDLSQAQIDRLREFQNEKKGRD